MARVATVVRPMLWGLYMYAPEPLAHELKALHGFINDVVACSAQGPLDAGAIRTRGVRHALTDFVRTGDESGDLQPPSPATST
ncbi:hypothetical protein [Cupriavidus sp. BIC8F]|uniref:hypothetical protein n=1 Tax=Cupriavidus sp. BIC8F TaxID=3079014 RepID=UPI002916A6FE|nr:hypothetical protein [Cupriavidus sp. BIC8F]